MHDVVVIGGGVIGLLSALELQARGRQVCLLTADQYYPPASWAGGGILSALFPWRYSSALSALTRCAFSDYQTWNNCLAAAGGPAFELSKVGLLVPAVADEQVALSWAAANEVRLERVSTQDVCALLNAEPALWMPEIGQLRSSALLKSLRWLFLHNGGVLHNFRVQRLVASDGGWKVYGANQALETQQLLVAAGAWSRSLLVDAFPPETLFPAKGEMLLFPPVVTPPPCIILRDEGYIIPRQDGWMLVGSTLLPDELDQRPTESGYRKLKQVAAKVWPKLTGIAPIAHWAGIRPGSSRDWPWISEVPGAEGVFVATGHYRNGLVSAPATARLVAQLMCNEQTALDIGCYSLLPSSSSSP